MKAEFRVLACAAAIVCSGLSGCVLGVPGVHDVNVVAVDVVNDPTYHPPRERLIKVTFSSRRNLFQYQQNYWWLVGGEFHRCENGSPKGHKLSSFGPDWRNLDVSTASADDYARILHELRKEETHLYDAYLRIRNDRIKDPLTSNPEIALYDLEKDPQDVCYQVLGGGLWGHFRSNIAPIPKEAIVSAFERARERAVFQPTK